MKKIDVRYVYLIAFASVFAVIVLIASLLPNRETTPISKSADTTELQIDTVKAVTMRHLSSSNLYGLHCKMCHGNYGIGDGVKARFDTTICPYDLTKVTKPDKEVYYVVLNGKEKMPNQHELDTTDVWVIVVYIKKFRK